MYNVHVMYLWEIWLAVGPLPVQVLISSHRRSGCTICTCKYWRNTVSLMISCSFSLYNQSVTSFMSAFTCMCININMLKIISGLTEIFSKNDPISIHKGIHEASVFLPGISQHMICKCIFKLQYFLAYHISHLFSSSWRRAFLKASHTVSTLFVCSESSVTGDRL